MRRLLLLAILVLALRPLHASAVVQFPVTPDPATCDAEPIAIDRLLIAAATPGPTASWTPLPAPDESEAQDFHDLIEVLIASVACTNANEPLRALSYFTEGYLLYRISDEPTVTLGHLRAASSRQPGVAPIPDRVTIQSVFLGTMAAGMGFLIAETVSGNESNVSHLYMVETVDGWKINDVVDPNTD